MEKVIEKLSEIKNPVSGKTFSEEVRLKSVQEKEGNLEVVYNSTGIGPQEKRQVEDQMIEALQGDWSEDNIIVKPFSENASTPTQGEQKPAPLKVGHEQAAPKKRVPNVGKVVAISSCKGGVGKSTFTSNLAIALKNQGKKVGVIDADIYGPSLPTLFGKKDEKPSASTNNKIKPIEAFGLKFISFGLFVEESEPVIWRGPMLGGVLNQFLFDTDWGELDYLLIDLPPGTGDIQLSMVQNTEVDGAVIISTPQELALLDTKKGMQMFKKVEVPIIGMIENMSYFVPDDSDKKYYIFGEGGVEKAAAELETNFLGDIPIEMALREGSDKGRPYMEEKNHEGRPVWNSYMDVAQKIDKLLGGTEKKGFFGKLFNR